MQQLSSLHLCGLRSGPRVSGSTRFGHVACPAAVHVPAPRSGYVPLCVRFHTMSFALQCYIGLKEDAIKSRHKIIVLQKSNQSTFLEFKLVPAERAVMIFSPFATAKLERPSRNRCSLSRQDSPLQTMFPRFIKQRRKEKKMTFAGNMTISALSASRCLKDHLTCSAQVHCASKGFQRAVAFLRWFI